jgi:hypothetical protein
MAKPKKVKETVKTVKPKEVKEVKAKTVLEDIVETEETLEPSFVEPKEPIVFDGREVLEVLGGDNGKGEYPCLMTDGTKTLVPVNLFK